MELVTLEMSITSSGKYEDRLTHKELTPEVKSHLTELLKKINSLLGELGITKVEVSSGFRPSDVNGKTKGAAKHSLHQTGWAIDILDDHNQSLAKAILIKPELLEKYDLWIEDPAHTIGTNTNWVHLDQGTRSPRPIRKFIP
jgi:hypothetical protein